MIGDTVQGSFESLLAAHDRSVVWSVVMLLENNGKWVHSGLYELRLPDELRIRILALRARLHAPAVAVSAEPTTPTA